MQNASALAHFFDTQQVTVIAVSSRADRHLELQLLINQIWLGLAQIVLDPARPQVRPAQAEINSILFRNDPNALRAIHENAVPREKRFRLIEIHHYLAQKLATLLDPTRRQVT